MCRDNDCEICTECEEMAKADRNLSTLIYLLRHLRALSYLPENEKNKITETLRKIGFYY